MRFIFTIITVIIAQFSIAQTHSFYFVGDIGEDTTKQSSVLKEVKRQIAQSKDSSTVILLGDNIYVDGLPDLNHVERLEKQNRLENWLSIKRQYQDTKVVVIPGNHDWNNSKEGGIDAVKREEEFVEEYLQDNNSFFPSEACPGPSISMPIIGSLYPILRARGLSRQDINNEVYQEFISAIKDVIGSHKKVVYLAGHEHNLQLQQEQNFYHIISGSGSKTTYLKNSKNLLYGSDKKGFAKIEINEKGNSKLIFYHLDKNNEITTQYSKNLY